MDKEIDKKANDIGHLRIEAAIWRLVAEQLANDLLSTYRVSDSDRTKNLMRLKYNHFKDILLGELNV